ncbi:helix-turn-helix transcriptional regulator [Nocardia otitidiscaviarum]|uniref:Helix-turn-helix transcriptional regulator n=1 Tax=Nocardia otitidiscaviarum TaxID=1823 RepID=A0A516NQT2_9NOCA|nr:helix-turn-helix domain-containing protein [Nocardia otitidiscaviarum]MCP9620374.1 AraC family transcriptional regulator [Nocardia otitidiscaviarum]QDP81251.1 helix-turn-helix transcriptional regulator [Nocardia otitidiscaviarum]
MDWTADSPPRGLLDPRAGAGVYREGFVPVSEDLAHIVAHHWSVRWDLRGREPFDVEVLPSPAVVLVVEDARCRVHGVLRGKYAQKLSGRGDIFGTTFRPAGFRTLIDRPVADLSDRVVPGSDLFGSDADRLAARISAESDTRVRCGFAEDFVRQRCDSESGCTALLNEIVDAILTDRTIVRVDDLTQRFGLGKRHLQKLFRDHAGVSPKWVIQRYRLHEAAQRLHEGYRDLAALAAELGYADQAHFARDFKTVVGRPPATYRGGVR